MASRELDAGLLDETRYGLCSVCAVFLIPPPARGTDLTRVTVSSLTP
jgi:hypothetical protein